MPQPVGTSRLEWLEERIRKNDVYQFMYDEIQDLRKEVEDLRRKVEGREGTA